MSGLRLAAALRPRSRFGFGQHDPELVEGSGVPDVRAAVHLAQDVGLPGVVAASAEVLGTAIRDRVPDSRGGVSFSTPGYSSDGHALVYASYVCGTLCGKGWFVLLEHRGGAWRVASVALLFVA